jgi:hypothetical protein
LVGVVQNMGNNILLGREDELRMIHRLMDKRRNLIIFGEEGVGKTSLIQRVLTERKASFMLFSAKSTGLRESLVNFILSAQDSQRGISEKNILSLKKIFYSLLKRNPEYIIFNRLGRVGPRFCSLFEYLIDKELPLLIVCRGLTEKDLGHLKMWSSHFEKVAISNLDQQNTIALVEQYVREYKLNLSRQDDFAREIFHFSKGNPGIMKELCFLARDGKYQKNGCVDVKLIDLDRRIQEIPI